MKSFSYSTYNFYSGEKSEDGKRHGQGIQYWNDGSYYDGQWKLDLPMGYGKLRDEYGNVYNGEW